jgi:hypothetical protein
LGACAAGTPEAGAPHEWQKRAPGESDDPQEPHAEPASGAPHAEQKRPSATAPQLGQVFELAVPEGEREGDVMAEM